MVSHKTLYNSFLYHKLIASLLISKQSCVQLNATFPLVFSKINLLIHTIKSHDINLLTINALWFLWFGQYPSVIFDKNLAKYRKSQIIFRLTFTKKTICYHLAKTLLLAAARQVEFTGYVYKTILMVYPQASFAFPLQTLQVFYLIDFLYGQQSKSILRVNQAVTINVDCIFGEVKSSINYDILRLLNVPINAETTIPAQTAELMEDNVTQGGVI